jgi:hypothetical protein
VSLDYRHIVSGIGKIHAVARVCVQNSFSYQNKRDRGRYNPTDADETSQLFQSRRKVRMLGSLRDLSERA